jgi:hypothetical protein
MSEYTPFFPYKALAYPDRCRAIVAGKMPMPVQVTVYPTNRCNRNCRWCIMADERKSGAELDASVWDMVLRLGDTGEVKCLRVSGGGEPTLYSHLREAKRFRGTRLLDTNGTALTRDTCHAFDRVRVSLNAGTGDGYAAVTGCTHEEWRDLLERIRSVCRKPRDWSVGTAMVFDGQTQMEIGEFIRRSASMGADWCHIRPAFFAKGTTEATWVMEEWPRVAPIVERMRLEVGIAIHCTSDKFRGYWDDRGFEKCQATPLVAVVTADARLALCQDVFTKWGDLNTMSFSEAWNCQAHRDVIAGIDLAKCPRCIMGRHNEVIEHCFESNDCCMEVM